TPEQIPVHKAPPATDPMPWAPGWLKSLLTNRNAPVLIGIGVGAVLALVGGFFVLTRRSRKSSVEVSQAAALRAGDDGRPELTLESIQKQIDAKFAEQHAEKARQTAEALAALRLPVTTKKAEVLSRHIAEETKKDPAAMAQVVRSWISGQDR